MFEFQSDSLDSHRYISIPFPAIVWLVSGKSIVNAIFAPNKNIILAIQNISSLNKPQMGDKPQQTYQPINYRFYRISIIPPHTRTHAHKSVNIQYIYLIWPISWHRTVKDFLNIFIPVQNIWQNSSGLKTDSVLNLVSSYIYIRFNRYSVHF